jgi:hypothetical protein
VASSIDQQFIEYIVKSLVSHPDAVKIDRRIDEKGVLLELTVDQEDLGRVIGKRGATAQSLRTLLRALGTKNDARYNLKIVDVGPPPEDRARRAEESSRPQEEMAPDESSPVAQDTSDDATPVPDDTSTVATDDLDMNEDEALPETAAEDRDRSDVVSRTRKELEELDDLDV